MTDLYKKALDYLARREHSALELKQKLESKAEGEPVAELLAKLAQEGLQSDARFAESYIRARRSAGFGPLRIKQELRQRGVADELIEHNLCLEEGSWRGDLQQVWQKKYHDQSSVKSEQQEYARQVRFLAQRGFDHHMIIEFLNNKVE